MSRWMVRTKRADFKGLGEAFGIDQVVARVIRNRDVIEKHEFQVYLSDSLDYMHNPRLLKDMDKSVELINNKIDNNKKIRVIGDYDIDGICATTILVKGLGAAGAQVDYMVPDRIVDGYGINESLIDRALQDGVDTIVTCDNGIAAIEQVRYAKDNGMTVIVTDHHDIPFSLENGGKTFLKVEADAVINPKQGDCNYPYKLLCGATVAYKLIECLYKVLGLDSRDLEEYRQLAAIATIGDIVELKDENRILVKYGLKTMKDTKNIGIKALFLECGVDIENVSSYHIGFIVGPCLNASGRLKSASKAVELLLADSEQEAVLLARELKNLNEERKNMTEVQAKKAIELGESEEYKNQNVLVLYLPDCHESIAGIIAGRVREYFYKPAIVITDAEYEAKGSGRSVEGYNMFEELTACRDLLDKFGGHPMAAGLSLKQENISKLRERLNTNCTLTSEDLDPVLWIDVPMPLSYVNIGLVEELGRLEPFGKGNEKPLFADKNLLVRGVSIIGKNSNVLKMQLETDVGSIADAICFSFDPDNVPQKDNVISVVYYPDVNEYKGMKRLQFIVKEWRRQDA